MVSPQLIRLFKVLSRINEVTYRLQLPHQFRVSPSYNVSLLRPVVPWPLQEVIPCHMPLPALIIDGSPACAMRALLESYKRGERLQYLVGWEGYGPEEHSWMPTEDVLDPFL